MWCDVKQHMTSGSGKSIKHAKQETTTTYRTLFAVAIFVVIVLKKESAHGF